MLHCHRNKLNLKNFSRGQLISSSFFFRASTYLKKFKRNEIFSRYIHTSLMIESKQSYIDYSYEFLICKILYVWSRKHFKCLSCRNTTGAVQVLGIKYIAFNTPFCNFFSLVGQEKKKRKDISSSMHKTILYCLGKQT